MFLYLDSSALVKRYIDEPCYWETHGFHPCAGPALPGEKLCARRCSRWFYHGLLEHLHATSRAQA